MRNLFIGIMLVCLTAACDSDSDNAADTSSDSKTSPDMSKSDGSQRDLAVADVTNSDVPTNEDGGGDSSGDVANDPDIPVGETGFSFFVTSVGNGPKGGDYGGLVGADARCAELATAAGSNRTTWAAYLSVDGPPIVNAGDRIGAGPWTNGSGDVVAADLAALHANGIVPALMENEMGDPVEVEIPGPEHDILTGSNEDGTLRSGETCADWTSSVRQDRGRVGHHDWEVIPNPISPNQNWNSVHTARCSEQALIGTGGSGRIYCFAQ